MVNFIFRLVKSFQLKVHFKSAAGSNKLLKVETLAEATRPQFTTGDYGFGFQIGRRDDGGPTATVAALRE